MFVAHKVTTNVDPVGHGIIGWLVYFIQEPSNQVNYLGFASELDGADWGTLRKVLPGILLLGDQLEVSFREAGRLNSHRESPVMMHRKADAMEGN